MKPREAERLLMQWANTETIYPSDAPRPFSAHDTTAIKKTDDAIIRLIKHWPEVFRRLPPAPPRPPAAETLIASEHWDVIAGVQHFLRLAWNAPDMRAREWFLFLCRYTWRKQTLLAPLMEARTIDRKDAPIEEMLTLTSAEIELRDSAPELDAFERAMYHFHKIATQARHCSNPTCPAPFFFAKKLGQKYCSSICAGPSQREQKRLWWRANRGKKAKP